MKPIIPYEWRRIRAIKRLALEQGSVPNSDIQVILDIAKRSGTPIPLDLYKEAKKRKLNLDGIEISGKQGVLI